jgi:hypothetical protein
VRAIEKCPYPLRCIEVFVPKKEEILVFLTHHPTLGATTIAAIYKDRWQMELLDKIKSTTKPMSILELWAYQI